jgi:hypothetical protein
LSHVGCSKGSRRFVAEEQLMHTDSDSNLSCPLIFPEMTSVYHPLGQILCGEEGEPRQYAFPLELGQVTLDGPKKRRLSRSARVARLTMATTPGRVWKVKLATCG